MVSVSFRRDSSIGIAFQYDQNLDFQECAFVPDGGPEKPASSPARARWAARLGSPVLTYLERCLYSLLFPYSTPEFERDLIRERTSAGRVAAQKRGVRFGRPRKLNTDQAKVAAQLLSEGKAVRDNSKDIRRTRGHDLSLGCYSVTYFR